MHQPSRPERPASRTGRWVPGLQANHARGFLTKCGWRGLRKRLGPHWQDKTRVTGRVPLPSFRMIAGIGAVDRGALLVIRSWCTDGALRLGRGPVKSLRASVRGGPYWHRTRSEPIGSDNHGRAMDGRAAEAARTLPLQLPCHEGGQSTGSRIHRFRPWRTGGRRAPSHQRGGARMKQIPPHRNSRHHVER